MSILAWVAGLALSGLMGMAAFGKLTGQKMSTDMRDHLAVPAERWKLIGGAELVGVAGLILGVIDKNGDYEWFGFLASLGIIALLVGALIYHKRAGDEPKAMMGAVMGIVLAVLYIAGITGR